MPEFHAVLEENGKYTLPMASFNLELQERRSVCTSMKGIKVSIGFSANPKKLVSMKDLSFPHCKAHDCHVMLMMFLPIVIRAIKPEFLKMAITCVFYFFSKIS
jgi:hypothetical protein